MVFTMKESIMSGLLYNLTYMSGASDDYCRGIVVSVFCILIADGLTADLAIETMREWLPKDGGHRFEEVLEALHWNKKPYSFGDSMRDLSLPQICPQSGYPCKDLQDSCLTYCWLKDGED